MLFVELQEAVDPVVDSYARTNLKLMNISLRVDVSSSIDQDTVAVIRCCCLVVVTTIGWSLAVF